MALKLHAELTRQIAPDFRTVDNKLHLKHLTWKFKDFHETLLIMFPKAKNITY